MTIDFKKIRARYRLWRRRKTVKHLAKENAAKIAHQQELQQRIYRDAVDEILMTHALAPGGIVVIDVVRHRIERYASVGALKPQSQRDLLEDCEWWKVDISHAYNNHRQLSDAEIQALSNELKGALITTEQL